MRNIFIVNATQVVVSESHPEGAYSVMPGYPKTFDSSNYDDNVDKAKAAAKAEYYSRLGALYVGSDARVMATVMLEAADGMQLLREKIGGFPNVPEPEEVLELGSEEEP